MRIAVTGASGLIGRHLIGALTDRGDTVVALSRQPSTVARAATARWDPLTEPLPSRALDTDAIVNLAGAPIARGRLGARHRRRILHSRVLTTRRIANALVGGGPRTLVSGSAIGYYGLADSAVDETAPAGDDFLASVCVAWERETTAASAAGVRVVNLRTGHVLARDGGLLPMLKLPAQLGLSGPLGDGRHWQSWIHIDDEVGLILHALDHADVNGPLNATAPNAVRQRDLASALGRALRRPARIPTPRFALRLALGGMADVALTSQRVTPAVALRTGYQFRFPEIDGAFCDLVARG